MQQSTSHRSSAFRGRRFLVALSGGIAAYKIGFMVRELTERGADVHVAMTGAATRFVGAATFEALTGRPPLCDLLAPAGGSVTHVEIARSADAAVVAPATANLLAKMALGLADDAPSTLLLATRAPVLVAPAMNDAMWQHPATVENMDRLKARGVHVVGPVEGFLAEGYEAVGRMAEPETILRALETMLAERGD